MNLEKKKVFVSGADGFIGSHLVECLVSKGIEVKAFVYYNSLNSWGWLDTYETNILKRVEIVAGDIRDKNYVRNAVRGCNIIFHLAALIAIPYSYVAPESYIDTNVRGTLNILEAARDHNAEKIIITSSSEVYGTAQYVPIDEVHPLNAQSPYAATKICADQLALSFFKSFDTPVSILRPFNNYGPRQSLRAVIPTIISQIAAGIREIKLGSLHPTRDLLYVKDTVNAFLNIAECDQAVGQIFNAGTEEEISIGDLAKLIISLMNVDVKVVEDEIRVRPDKSEVERLLAETSKIKTLTSWRPHYTLVEGLRETIEWYKDKRNLKIFKTNIYNT